MSDIPQDLQKIAEHVRGYMTTAADPSFANPFHDILKKISEIDLASFGLEADTGITVDVPCTFFSRAGANSLRLVSLGGEVELATKEELNTFRILRMKAELRRAKERIQFLEHELRDADNNLESLGFYDEPKQ